MPSPQRTATVLQTDPPEAPTHSRIAVLNQLSATVDETALSLKKVDDLQ